MEDEMYCVCKKCGNRWVSLSKIRYNQDPKQCPRCKSTTWKLPKKSKRG